MLINCNMNISDGYNNSFDIVEVIVCILFNQKKYG